MTKVNITQPNSLAIWNYCLTHLSLHHYTVLSASRLAPLDEERQTGDQGDERYPNQVREARENCTHNFEERCQLLSEQKKLSGPEDRAYMHITRTQVNPEYNTIAVESLAQTRTRKLEVCLANAGVPKATPPGCRGGIRWRQQAIFLCRSACGCASLSAYEHWA